MLNSIKLKILIWFLVVFSIISTGLGLFLYQELKYFSLNQVDDQMNKTIQTLSSVMLIEESHGQLEMELWELSNITSGKFSEKLSGHYYQILSTEGSILARSPSLGMADATLPVVTDIEEAGFETIIGPNDVPLRLLSQISQLTTTTVIIQIGESLENTYALLGSLKNIIIIILPVAFVLACLGGLIITRRALRPLNTFSAKLGQITEENLNTRVEETGLTTELQPLAASFNTMLGRIEGAFSRQRQFLSDASHELRTPTSIIKGYCDVTLNRERTADEYRAALLKIGDSVNRMCDIINRLLVISRLDSKTLHIKPSRMDVLDILKDVLRLIEPAAAGKRIKVTMDGRSLSIRGDREGLTEVFTNIVENAIKYNKEEGSVNIDVGSENGWIAVSVEDTGIGIPEEEIGRIFDRFYRVDTSRGQTVGSGLGLSIVQSIINAHGGKIEVLSKVGKGSTFRVLLPIDFMAGKLTAGNVHE